MKRTYKRLNKYIKINILYAVLHTRLTHVIIYTGELRYFLPYVWHLNVKFQSVFTDLIIIIKILIKIIKIGVETLSSLDIAYI